MLNGRTLRLVLVISCAHALVHTYELSLPSVEQRLAEDYSPDDAAAGKRLTGLMSSSWRLTFGLGALAAGWLVDRFGSRRMLAVYLLGCGAMCLVVGWMQSVRGLFAAMFAMGAFASIYHPAGLSLISLETTVGERPRAHGLHGIFGSAGIGLAPLAAWALIRSGLEWRQYYAILAVPGVALGAFFVWLAIRERVQRGDVSTIDAIDDRVRREAVRDNLSRETTRESASTSNASAMEPMRSPSDDDPADWPSFFLLTVLAMLQGFVYSAVLSFLPRYLSGGAGATGDSGGEVRGMLTAAGVLLVGCVGQYLSGRFARPEILERQLMWIAFGNAPFLIWMALADGNLRTIAAAGFALVHFMHQPVYNTLIAKYAPRRSRSLCYGFSFAMGLGLGSVGAAFNGVAIDQSAAYGTLAAVASGSGLLGLVLTRRNRAAAVET